MNFLSFIFALLLILSFGTVSLFEKQVGDRRLRLTFFGHSEATRKMFSHTETVAYRDCPGTFTQSPLTSKTSQETNSQEKELKLPPVNPSCARLNLWPLVQEGREEHPLLYEMAAQLFQRFYGATLFENKPRFEYQFLDLFLQKVKGKEASFPLEKLSFNNPSFQLLYYKMLKGTKQRDLPRGIGYPSLLDSISIEETPSKLCLAHAHPDQIAVFFGFKVGGKLFEVLHRGKPPPLTKELIEQICSECHVTTYDRKMFEWFALGRPTHGKTLKETLVEEDPATQISLRKNVYTATGRG